MKRVIGELTRQSHELENDLSHSYPITPFAYQRKNFVKLRI